MDIHLDTHKTHTQTHTHRHLTQTHTHRVTLTSMLSSLSYVFLFFFFSLNLVILCSLPFAIWPELWTKMKQKVFLFTEGAERSCPGLSRRLRSKGKVRRRRLLSP